MHHSITQDSLEQINEGEPIWEYVRIENCGKEERFTINTVRKGYLEAYGDIESAYDSLNRKIKERSGPNQEIRLIICELESKLLKNNKVQLRGRLIANGELVLSS